MDHVHDNGQIKDDGDREECAVSKKAARKAKKKKRKEMKKARKASRRLQNKHEREDSDSSTPKRQKTDPSPGTDNNTGYDREPGEGDETKEEQEEVSRFTRILADHPCIGTLERANQWRRFDPDGPHAQCLGVVTRLVRMLWVTSRNQADVNNVWTNRFPWSPEQMAADTKLIDEEPLGRLRLFRHQAVSQMPMAPFVMALAAGAGKSMASMHAGFQNYHNSSRDARTIPCGACVIITPKMLVSQWIKTVKDYFGTTIREEEVYVYNGVAAKMRSPTSEAEGISIIRQRIACSKVILLPSSQLSANMDTASRVFLDCPQLDDAFFIMDEQGMFKTTSNRSDLANRLASVMLFRGISNNAVPAEGRNITQELRPLLRTLGHGVLGLEETWEKLPEADLSRLVEEFIRESPVILRIPRDPGLTREVVIQHCPLMVPNDSGLAKISPGGAGENRDGVTADNDDDNDGDGEGAGGAASSSSSSSPSSPPRSQSPPPPPAWAPSSGRGPYINRFHESGYCKQRLAEGGLQLIGDAGRFFSARKAIGQLSNSDEVPGGVDGEHVPTVWRGRNGQCDGIVELPADVEILEQGGAGSGACDPSTGRGGGGGAKKRRYAYPKQDEEVWWSSEALTFVRTAVPAWFFLRSRVLIAAADLLTIHILPGPLQRMLDRMYSFYPRLAEMGVSPPVVCCIEGSTPGEVRDFIINHVLPQKKPVAIFVIASIRIVEKGLDMKYVNVIITLCLTSAEQATQVEARANRALLKGILMLYRLMHMTKKGIDHASDFFMCEEAMATRFGLPSPNAQQFLALAQEALYDTPWGDHSASNRCVLETIFHLTRKSVAKKIRKAAAASRREALDPINQGSADAEAASGAADPGEIPPPSSLDIETGLASASARHERRTKKKKRKAARKRVRADGEDKRGENEKEGGGVEAITGYDKCPMMDLSDQHPAVAMYLNPNDAVITSLPQNCIEKIKLSRQPDPNSIPDRWCTSIPNTIPTFNELMDGANPFWTTPNSVALAVADSSVAPEDTGLLYMDMGEILLADGSWQSTRTCVILPDAIPDSFTQLTTRNGRPLLWPVFVGDESFLNPPWLTHAVSTKTIKTKTKTQFRPDKTQGIPSDDAGRG